MSHSTDLPLTSFAGGVRLSVKARPGARQARAPKIVDVGDGQSAIELSVSAPPEDGKANKALIALLAEATGLRQACFSIKAGQTGKIKVIEVAGDPQALQALFETWARSFE